MEHVMRTLLIIMLGLLPAIAAACPPAGMSRTALVALKEAKGEVADNARRQALALGLLACLGDPDPVLRDDVAFGLLASWMRSRKLDPATVTHIRTTGLASLKQADAQGFAQPFAALVLAEVARADRIAPYLSASERAELVQAGAHYLATVRDYRGYDEQQGWRHGVAHAADMMMQLALNGALVKQDQQRILSAVAAQLTAAGAQSPPQFFHYGEGERLAMPVFLLAARAELAPAEWEAWFGTLAVNPSDNGVPGQAQLAHRHNVKSFMMSLYVLLSESKDAAQRDRALALVRNALRRR
jgi:hypothetical protein